MSNTFWLTKYIPVENFDRIRRNLPLHYSGGNRYRYRLRFKGDRFTLYKSWHRDAELDSYLDRYPAEMFPAYLRGTLTPLAGEVKVVIPLVTIFLFPVLLGAIALILWICRRLITGEPIPPQPGELVSGFFLLSVFVQILFVADKQYQSSVDVLSELEEVLHFKKDMDPPENHRDSLDDLNPLDFFN